MTACDGESSPPSEDVLGNDGGSHDEKDAGEADAAVDPFERDCELGSERFEQQVDAPGGRPFELDVAVDTGHLLYTVGTCPSGSGLPTGVGLRWAAMPSGGALPPAVPVADQDGECSSSRDPAVAAVASGRVYAYYARVDGAGERLFVHDLLGTAGSQPLSAQGEAVSVTTAAGVIESTAVAVWASRLPSEVATDLSLYRGSSSASRVVLVEASAGQRITSAAVAGLGRGERERALGVVAWVDEAPDSRGIRMQIVDEKGMQVGPASLLSDEVGVASSVDAVAHVAGGALTYTVNPLPTRGEIRLLLLDENGQAMGGVINVTSGEQNARDASVTRYATGYAVVYRALPADPGLGATIRVAAFDEQGHLAGTRDVAPAGLNAGQVRAVQANDGRLFVAWTDDDDSHTTLHVVRALCQ